MIYMIYIIFHSQKQTASKGCSSDQSVVTIPPKPPVQSQTNEPSKGKEYMNTLYRYYPPEYIHAECIQHRLSLHILQNMGARSDIAQYIFAHSTAYKHEEDVCNCMQHLNILFPKPPVQSQLNEPRLGISRYCCTICSAHNSKYTSRKHLFVTIVSCHFKKRQALFAHGVCGRSVLFAHSVCGRNGLFAHGPGYLLSCNYMILCKPAAAAAKSAE